MAQRLHKQPWETLIDENLKKVFDEDAKADLPQNLMDLLDQLDKIPVSLPPTASDAKPSQSQEEAE